MVKVDKLVLLVGEQRIELSMEEAGELHEQLSRLFSHARPALVRLREPFWMEPNQWPSWLDGTSAPVVPTQPITVCCVEAEDQS